MVDLTLVEVLTGALWILTGGLTVHLGRAWGRHWQYRLFGGGLMFLWGSALILTTLGFIPFWAPVYAVLSFAVPAWVVGMVVIHHIIDERELSARD